MLAHVKLVNDSKATGLVSTYNCRPDSHADGKSELILDRNIDCGDTLCAE